LRLSGDPAFWRTCAIAAGGAVMASLLLRAGPDMRPVCLKAFDHGAPGRAIGPRAMNNDDVHGVAPSSFSGTWSIDCVPELVENSGIGDPSFQLTGQGKRTYGFFWNVVSPFALRH
jgi:hypothetical protein